MSEQEPIMEFALLLIDLKRRTGRSFEALGRGSKVSGSTLHRWCRGERVPRDFAGLRRYATLCGATREELAEIHRRWTRAEVATRLLAGRTAGAAPDAARLPPAQLPAAPAVFVGRSQDVRRLDRLLIPGANRSHAMVTATIVGPAGVGKSALATHWAHRVRRRFPGGQLYVNLRGFDPQRPPLTPGAALLNLLGGLAARPPEVPADVDTRAALYRSLLARGQVLVVLDNARDADQVRPLLPGTPGCLVVVTSRDQLTGLVAAGAHAVCLDPLGAAEAATLLTHRLGRERVASERSAAEEIVEACGGLPLALTIIAAKAAIHPTFPLAELAAELRDAGRRLDALHGGDRDTDVRAAFFQSYQAVSASAARLFRLIGSSPGPDVTVAQAALLAGITHRDARRGVGELARVHLVTEAAPGRYAAHQLLRAYASELAGTRPRPGSGGNG